LKIYKNKLRIIKKYSNNKNPKISVISPIYNKENFISRFIMIIQNQYFKNLEIILIDDYSKDNSVKLIEDYKKIDKRIKLIKNKKNQGIL
jgi:teichuronic acid biosynthesis glycosyltransferase TuaG